MSRPELEPGPDHPITINPTPDRVVVKVNGHVIADTIKALTLKEAEYDPVQYIPIEDIDRSVLSPSDTTSYCPYKGEANYYNVAVEGTDPEEDLIWYYAHPRPAVFKIADHVAFYETRVHMDFADH